MKIADILDDYVSPALPVTLEATAEICLDGAAGVVVPGVGNMLLSYKQKQQEKRFERAIEEVRNRQDEIDNIIKEYDETIKPVIELLFEMYLDYSVENTQEAKIEYLTNGYINSVKVEKPQEDVIRGFYDTLAQVNMLDIRVLKLYGHSILDENEDSYRNILEDYDIDYSQYDMIRLKLVRLGLIVSKNELKQDENVGYVIDYLQAINKNKSSEAKRALSKMKKISRSESYQITSYGRNFLQFFCNL